MRSLSAALLLAFCSFALGGALVFAWLQKTQGSAALQSRLDQTTGQLAQAETRISTLLAEKHALELALRGGEDCGEFQDGAADGFVGFVDEERGLAVQLPFNDQWGYANEPIGTAFLPLSDIDGIQFGPPYEVAPCTFAHSIQLTFIPARGSGAIQSDVLERNAARLAGGEVTAGDLAPEKIAVGDVNLTAYRYSVPGECAKTHVEVIGQEFNYVFSACPAGEAVLPSVLDSIELLN